MQNSYATVPFDIHFTHALCSITSRVGKKDRSHISAASKLFIAVYIRSVQNIVCGIFFRHG